MKNIKWDDSLSVDVEEIDEDHRKLVDLFNVLSESVEEGASIEYIEAVLEELICFTVWHFKHEERLMIKYVYESCVEHKAEHDDLIESVREMQQKFSEAQKLLTNDDIEYLAGWLTGHILGHDMKLGFQLMKVI